MSLYILIGENRVESALKMVSSCHKIDSGRKGKGYDDGKFIKVALAGNANVGKSIIFNYSTGSHQIIGNWPGKTVEISAGYLFFNGYRIEIVDLPGIYSLSTYSQEEMVSRGYIAIERPDIVINVVDASVLERNLFFTLQLIEMEIPLIICLNQMDMALRKGMKIDIEKLEEALGVPVVGTVAIRGDGIYELMDEVITLFKGIGNISRIRFREEIEKYLDTLVKVIVERKLDVGYSPRFISIKLLENDEEIWGIVGSIDKYVLDIASRLIDNMEEEFGEPSYAIIASERYRIISEIVSKVVKHESIEFGFIDWLDWFTTHKVFGYITSIGIITLLLLWTFIVGDYLSTLFENIIGIFQEVEPLLGGSIYDVIWNGIVGGVVAGITLVIPYVVPFYLFLAVIEDSGIMTRIAFMIDSLMHKLGLHGKAIIPLILGYGCNVPAIYTTRIMETRRERILAALAITFIPCSARTIVILGLVSRFIGFEWALFLYALDILIIFVIGKVALKFVPGESTGLIMEIHSFRMPSLRVVLRQTLYRTKSIIFLVFPIYIVGTASIQVFYTLGLLSPINLLLSPITVSLLGLPDNTSILLLFGIVRKELILLLIPALYGTLEILSFMTPLQIFILALVSILYIPCISTFTILVKEFGWRDAIYISIGNIFSAIVIGGLIYRLTSILL